MPAGVLVVKLKVPAVPEHTMDNPCKRTLPSKTTSPAEAFTPAETFPAGSPTAVMAVTVSKYLEPVAVPALAPVILSV